MKKLVNIFLKLYKKSGNIRNNVLKNISFSLNYSPITNNCRFNPTCSEYTRQAISHFGIVKGLVLGLVRISRCHPWSVGGYDPLINTNK
jgi:putative membrane protein insertion efficiency factor